MITPSRRSFLIGASAFLATPAIVRVASLMPVSVIAPTLPLGVYAGSGARPALLAAGNLYWANDGQLFISDGVVWLQFGNPLGSRPLRGLYPA